MINVTIFRDSKDTFLGFDCIGHAEYAPEGEDIICAGVSALVINTVNSIAQLSGTECETKSDEKTGRIMVRFLTKADQNADLLMHSLVLGLQGIENSYGNQYIHVNFKEV